MGRISILAVEVALLVGLMLLTGPVAAHGKLLRADPKPGSTVKAAPSRVRAWFNEELDAKRSTLTVSDRAGKRVDKAKGGVDLDDLDRSSMVVSLQSIGPGTYVVRWSAVSADDANVAKGSFRFVVATPGGSMLHEEQGAAPTTAKAMPPLKIISPTNGATVENPIKITVETTADMSKSTMGGKYMAKTPALHLHVDIGSRMVMPTMAQITRVRVNRYRVDVGISRTGPQTIRVYWGDVKHKPLGPTETVRVTVK